MIAFLRKYQRLFLIGITIILVITFLFFGTYGSNSNLINEREDKIIGKAVDDSVIKLSDINFLSYFLSSDQLSVESSSNKRGDPNFLNDGVIIKDFINSGIAELLVKHYFTHLKEDFEERVKKVKNYIFYSHPQANFLSVQSIYKHLKPSVIANWQELKNFNHITPESMSFYIKIYQDQMNLSSEMIKQILLYQQSQYPWISPDQRIVYGDFSLFGFSTLEDWFGKNFVDMISQFILNMAVIAEQKGYVVTDKEALYSLHENVKIGFKKHHKSKQVVVPGVEKELFRYQLHNLGIDENRVVNLWKKILLCRRYMEDVGDAVFLDTLFFEEYKKFANEEFVINNYNMPSHLCLDNFNKFLLLQIYKKATTPYNSAEKNHHLALSDNYYPIEEIENKFPELIEKKYLISVSKATVSEIGLIIGERKMWEWQLKEENWVVLQNNFTKLKKEKNQDRYKRFNALEKLSREERKELDMFSREKMVSAHPEWIDEYLNKVSSSEKEIYLRSASTVLPFEDIFDHEKLKSIIELASIKDEKNKTFEQNQIESKLAKYSEDNKTYYKIEVLSKNDDKELVSFAKAVKDGTLEKVLNKILVNKYEQIRVNQPEKFKTESNDWKAFADVKNIVGAYYFSEVLKQIDNKYKEDGGTIDWVEGEGPEDFYYSHYLDNYSEKIRSNLIACPEKASNLILSETNKNETIEDQWKFIETEEIISRKSENEKIKSLLFSKNEFTWSELIKNNNGQSSFFNIKQRRIGDKENEFEINKERDLLGREAIISALEKIISSIDDKKAIILPVVRHGNLEGEAGSL
jgi:hypothetical protein